MKFFYKLGARWGGHCVTEWRKEAEKRKVKGEAAEVCNGSGRKRIGKSVDISRKGVGEGRKDPSPVQLDSLL